MLENLSGMRLKKFYEFCQGLAESRLSQIINMAIVCLFLLFR